jgi:hypothetical protein
MKKIYIVLITFILSLNVVDVYGAANPPGPGGGGPPGPGGGGPPGGGPGGGGPPPPPPPPPDPCFPNPCIPIDGGIAFLAAAAIAFGGKKLLEKNKNL